LTNPTKDDDFDWKSLQRLKVVVDDDGLSYNDDDDVSAGVVSKSAGNAGGELEICSVGLALAPNAKSSSDDISVSIAML
jgi:hypothetical protein